ncbi:Uncharacterised protein [Clostridium putrefaciens]|uniref:Uncharacterized protein n=1 Tax=Clostridium putrefaciens TaxID=99675 RepID=A0A381J871_9CLOT|nr:hypothetical protein [Clostridium putrefaciens]SUY47460.1 Uncharacterised protein [Clostridium putrefaciens]
MGIGYILGCLISIIFWKVERQVVFRTSDKILKKRLKYKILMNIFYMIFIFFVYNLMEIGPKGEMINFIIAFIVIDISNSEKKNLEHEGPIKFYGSITLACKSILCGFVAPLFYIALFSNTVGIIYFLIYNISEIKDYDLFKILNNILNIVPALIIQIFFYYIYIFRNKKFEIDFKGDYIKNSITKPLLNIEIMAAYIESINFYHHFEKNSINYIKEYGGYNSKIDEYCIKDYLSVTYALSFIFFAMFMGVVFLYK